MAPELVEGVVKVGWWAHCHNLKDRGLLWPNVPPCFPLPSHLILEEVNNQRHAQNTKQKSRDHSHKSGYRFFTLTPLWLLLMPQRMTAEEVEAF